MIAPSQNGFFGRRPFGLSILILLGLALVSPLRAQQGRLVQFGSRVTF